MIIKMKTVGKETGYWQDKATVVEIEIKIELFWVEIR